MSVLKCIVNYFKKHFILFVITVLILIAVTLLSLVPPQVLRIIVDEIVVNKDMEKLLKFAIYYMLLFVCIGFVNFLKEFILVKIGQGITKKIKLQMLSKVNKITYTEFSKYESGTLEAYFSNDVDAINTLITSGIVSMAIDLLKIVGIVISVFYFSYLFGIITLIILPFIVLFTMFVRKRMFKAQIKNRALEGSVNNLVLESLDNIVTIKSFRIYDKMKSKYSKVLDGHYETNQNANFYDSLFSPVMQIVKTTLICSIIILSSYNMSLFGMTVGMLVASIDLLTNLFAPIESLGMELQTIQKSMAGIKRINDFFKIEEDQDKKELIDFDYSSITLKFENVYYSYDNEKDVIKDFNLELNKEDKITLKGRSGSGKSTLFKLAYGLIKPTKGRVTINGYDTYYLPNEIKRKIFGVVYQDYFFSSGTIKDEVCLLNNNISDDEVYNVLNLVGLNRIKNINEKLIITDYSTGELSLFNIARAIILDSKVLFLDEMNAKIDQLSASKILEVINNIAKDKIILSINHYGNLLDNSKILNLEELF